MCVKFFEELKVPEYYVMTQAVLALYSSGRTTGLVADVGDGVLHTVVVFDGFCIKHAINRLNLAGRDMTSYMKTLLMEIGLNLESSSGLEIARDIKEKTCYVAIDYASELNDFQSSDQNHMKYELPDGSECIVKG